jgi:hypothetical protein
VRRVPAERVAGAGTGRRLVHREDRAERAEVLLRYRLDWQAQAAADDRGDVQDRVALVGDGVPGRPGGQKATVTTAPGWRSTRSLPWTNCAPQPPRLADQVAAPVKTGYRLVLAERARARGQGNRC